MRVVLDTNVYISAILFGGNCEEILRLAALVPFEIIISKDILKEIEFILKKKFRWSKRQTSEAISYIKEIATVIKSDIVLSVIKKDPSDNRIIECAVAGQAHYIVTGDRAHLLSLGSYRNIKIYSPAEFLKL